MATKKTLINFIVDDPLLKRVEDFRFKNRFPTRAAAIKWLLDWAIKQKPSAKGQALDLEEDLSAVDDPAGANVAEASHSRAAALSALQDLVLKQKPSEAVAGVSTLEPPPLEPPPMTQAVPSEVAPDLAAPSSSTPVAAKAEPPALSSRESITQALRDQGYEVGDVVRHPDGQQRILVRSQDRSAWVNVVQELEDLAAARITIAQVAERRRAAGR